MVHSPHLFPSQKRNPCPVASLLARIVKIIPYDFQVVFHECLTITFQTSHPSCQTFPPGYLHIHPDLIRVLLILRPVPLRTSPQLSCQSWTALPVLLTLPLALRNTLRVLTLLNARPPLLRIPLHPHLHPLRIPSHPHLLRPLHILPVLLPHRSHQPLL